LRISLQDILKALGIVNAIASILTPPPAAPGAAAAPAAPGNPALTDKVRELQAHLESMRDQAEVPVTAAGQKRDVSRALDLVMTAQQQVQAGIAVPMTNLNEVAGILADIDARTGRRDPSKRKRANATAGKSKRKSRSVGAKKKAFDTANE
jgi:hypothetical protein